MGLKICMMVMFLVLVFVSTGKYYTTYGEKMLDVIVNLSNTNDNIGKYQVQVTVYGKETLDQTCPDDIDSLCYVSAGTFSFPSKSVPLDSKIEVCIKELSSGTQNCVYGQNTEKNTPELITVGVPRTLG